MTAHQRPSLNQSLLSGFEPDGAVLAPEKDWSFVPYCGFAAAAVEARPNRANATAATAKASRAPRSALRIKVVYPRDGFGSIA